MWKTRTLGKRMSKWKHTDTKHGSPKNTGNGSGNGSGKSKSKSKCKGKKRTPETCMCCGKEGHNRIDCKFKTATCSKCRKVDHLRAVCRNTNTHEIEKGADEPSPEVTVEAVWCMAVRDTVDDGQCDCIEKHDVSSENRDESKFTEFPEHRDESRSQKSHQERRDGSQLKKSHHEHRDGSKFWKSHHKRRDGSKFGKMVAKIAMGEQDSDEEQKSRHE